MKRHIIHCNKFMFGQALANIEGIPAEQVRLRFPGQANPPIWQVGHLLVVCSVGLVFLGKAPIVTDAEAAQFGNGSVFDPNGDYPAYADLVRRYREGSALRVQAFADAPEELLSRENPREASRGRIPTIGDMLVFTMTSHESYHFAQIAGWKRAATEAIAS